MEHRKISRETTIRWLVTPSYLRGLADRMERKWAAMSVGDSTLVEAVSDRTGHAMLEIHMNPKEMRYEAIPDSILQVRSKRR